MSRKNSHEPTSTRDPSWKNSATPTAPCTTTRPPKPPPPRRRLQPDGPARGQEPAHPARHLHPPRQQNTGPLTTTIRKGGSREVNNSHCEDFPLLGKPHNGLITSSPLRGVRQHQRHHIIQLVDSHHEDEPPQVWQASGRQEVVRVVQVVFDHGRAGRFAAVICPAYHYKGGQLLFFNGWDWNYLITFALIIP